MLGACSSIAYSRVEVMVSAQPVLSVVTNTGPYCEGSTIELEVLEIPAALCYWEGTFDKGDLPSGTYFYIIELNDGNETRMSGHVFIKR
ncbi:MAG: hypothetical protein ACI8YQ_001356 [Polaribacter sp.]